MAQDDASSFDELLALTQDDDTTEPVVPVPTPSKRTRKAAPKPEAAVDPLLAKIAAMEAELAKPVPSYPDPHEEEDPERAALREKAKDLEDQLARRKTQAIEGQTDYVQDSGPGETIHLHFVEDGFVHFGQPWYRGQELEIVVGSPQYERTKDREGNTWLSLVDDWQAQIARWGHVKFARGPFVPRPGESFNDSVAAEDARRGRAVPIVRN